MTIIITISRVKLIEAKFLKIIFLPHIQSTRINILSNVRKSYFIIKCLWNIEQLNFEKEDVGKSVEINRK